MDSLVLGTLTPIKQIVRHTRTHPIILTDSSFDMYLSVYSLQFANKIFKHFADIQLIVIVDQGNEGQGLPVADNTFNNKRITLLIQARNCLLLWWVVVLHISAIDC